MLTSPEGELARQANKEGLMVKYIVKIVENFVNNVIENFVYNGLCFLFIITL